MYIILSISYFENVFSFFRKSIYCFQSELKNIRQICELEKTNWIKNQTVVLAEKENHIKEICKKERDKHIELVVQKLENEAFEREKMSETKIK